MKDRDAIAQQVVEIVPQLLSRMSADMRCSGIGMDPSHFRVLGLLAARQHILSELAERQTVSMATMSKTIATLTERGWVERTVGATDRRVVQVALTPLGKQMLNDMHCLLRDKVSDLLVSLPESELTVLDAGLAVLHRALKGAGEPETHAFHAALACIKETGDPDPEKSE